MTLDAIVESVLHRRGTDAPALRAKASGARARRAHAAGRAPHAAEAVSLWFACSANRIT